MLTKNAKHAVQFVNHVLHSDGFVKETSNVLLSESVCSAKHHYAVLNAERIEMIKHDMIWFR